MTNNLEVRESRISGNGVFTNREIKKGQVIHRFTGELCTLEEIMERVSRGEEEPADPLAIGTEKYLDLDETSRTFNHSCDPNSYIKGENELIALRDIPIGEEITYDYSTTMNDNEQKIKRGGLKLWTASCNCGSKNCRGTIDQFKTLPQAVQQFYIGNRLMPDFMLEQFR